MDYKNDIHSDDDFDCSNGYGDHNGNNGYGSGQTRVGNNNGLTKAELRKTNKPIMEKRRRARINHCLNELKSLILEAMKKDPARHTKLEKADILEMTVKHLQSVQRQQLNMAIQTDPTVIHKFKTGFVECADEVNRYISQLDSVDVGVRQRLTSHLTNCATSLEQIGSMTNFNNGYRSQLNGNNNNNAAITAANLFGTTLPSNPLVAAAAAAVSQVTTPAAIFPPLPQDLNNNSNQGTPIQMGGVQLIPSRLPSGEFALIMPNPNQATASGGGSILNGAATLTSGGVPAAFNAAWPPSVVGGALPPLPATAAAPPKNDFTINFQRISAFSKPLQKIHSNNNSNSSSPFITHHQLSTGATFHQPQNNLHHNSTATTSPPLSPISSVSSHGDGDSIMHTSSDFNTTPTRPVTPPQDVTQAAQQHSFSGVFSTPSSAESSLNQSRSSTHLQQSQVSSTSGSELSASLKRPLAEACDSIDSSDSAEPLTKKFASAEKLGLSTPVSDEERDSMWRPW